MNKLTAQPNTSQNFILRGFNSIQVGLYLILFTFIFKSLFDGFLSDVSMLGMMSIEIIELMATVFIVLFIMLSGFAIFFSSRRLARKSGYKLMNKKTFRQFAFYVSTSFPAFIVLYFLASGGYSMYIGIAMLLFFGLILLGLNSQKKKPMFLLAGLSLLLAIISFLIPTYWYSSLMIMGGAFIVYGIMIKK